MTATSLEFPHLAASACLSTGFGEKTDITSNTFVAVGTGTQVAVNGSAGTIKLARIHFMVLTRSSTAPDLAVQVKWGNPVITRTIPAFTLTGKMTDKNNNNTDHFCYRASLDVSTETSLSSDIAFVAEWKVKTTGATVSIYNATLSVVATDWGDSILPG